MLVEGPMRVKRSMRVMQTMPDTPTNWQEIDRNERSGRLQFREMRLFPRISGNAAHFGKHRAFRETPRIPRTPAFIPTPPATTAQCIPPACVSLYLLGNIDRSAIDFGLPEVPCARLSHTPGRSLPRENL